MKSLQERREAKYKFCYTASVHNVKLLTWFNFFTDFKLYAPIAIIYFAEVSGSFALGMSVFSITMISSALFEIPTGVFSDRIGRKKTLIIGALSAVFAVSFYAGGNSFLLLAIGALFEGLSRSFYSGNNDALLYDTLSENNKQEHYAEYLGKISKMFQIALGISAFLAIFIIAFFSLKAVVWLSVIPQVFCLMIGFLIIEPHITTARSGNIYLHLKEAYRSFLNNKKLRLLSVSSILGYGLGETSYQFQAAFYNTVWPSWAIPFAKILSNTGAALSFHFSGRLIKKFNAFKIFILDNIYNRVINSIAVIFPTPISPLLMSSSSIFHGVTTVAKNSLMQAEFRDEQRATMGSLNSFAGSIFFGLIAFLIGLTADIFSPASSFLLIQGLQLINLLIYIKLFRLSSN